MSVRQHSRKYVRSVGLLIALYLCALLPVAAADWSQYLDSVTDVLGTTGDGAAALDLTDDEMVTALKQALDSGTQFAVSKLGQPGGFLDNKRVRIPMPESLGWVESSLRTVGQDELADEFVATMNHAAEQAVPEAAGVFGQAIQDMSIKDAQAILGGPDDAATDYFRSRTSEELTARMRPIVEAATAKTGVTGAYKNMLGAAGGLGGLLPSDATDLDGYITEQTLDGLFLMIAREERKIRRDPLARSTELMQKVFAAYN